MAEAAVRPARPADVAEIARIQRDTWHAVYPELFGDTPLDLAEIERALADVLAGERAKLFVAIENRWTVGFCVAGFAPDSEVADADGQLPDDAKTVALIGTLLVEPRWGRRGHGGRLLASAAAALRAAGATRGIAWIPAADSASLAFYQRAGWQPDGLVRTLDAHGRPVRELRVTGSIDLRLS